MAEVASFGNIVSSLVALRQNYHEQLKSVPQYDAFLLVQSSTEKAAGALNASADGPASIAAEVIDSLQFARSRFEQHLNSVPEYRTLLAIDKLIQEVSIDLGVAEPAFASAPELPEAATSEAATPEPLVAAVEAEEEPQAQAAEEREHDDAASVTAEAEADPVVAAVQAVESEAIARAPVESPLTPSRLTIDLDDALADDIMSVHVPRRDSAIEDGEDDDLLEIVHRDAKSAAPSASAKDAEEAA
jgi:hypothetical protein